MSFILFAIALFAAAALLTARSNASDVCFPNTPSTVKLESFWSNLTANSVFSP